jgi:hypothetical protein
MTAPVSDCAVIAGRSNGKRDRDGYVCWHGVCSLCRETVFKLWIGNPAGRRYAVPMARAAVNEHACEVGRV